MWRSSYRIAHKLTYNKFASTSRKFSQWQLFDQAFSNPTKVAIIQSHPQTHQPLSFTYSQLLQDANYLSSILQKHLSQLPNKNICYLVDPSYDYVVTQWAIWASHGTCVPLCNTHPLHEWEYYIHDSQSQVIIYQTKFESALKPLLQQHPHWIAINLDTLFSSKQSLPQIKREVKNLQDNSLMIYTSGTTGKPKGVVHTFDNISSQVNALLGPWKWSKEDRILSVLPLHHIHGLINVVTCALWSGATVEFAKFSAELVWKRFTQDPPLTLFMAVPTIYVKLIQYYESCDEQTRQQLVQGAHRLRLMVSGSAALPEPIFQRWKAITGHTLLERFGMSEIGMALSNPLEPISARKPGFVGFPLPGVQVRIVDEHNKAVDQIEGHSGELQVKGGSVFKEYWNKPEATKKTFDEDGWFLTGDVATVIDGYYKILGRSSVDIIKSSGFKISALDIERSILSFAHGKTIAECAVVGIPDDELGEKICAMIVPQQWDQSEDALVLALKDYLKQELAYYKIPKVWKVVKEIPRNAMGKVNKKNLLKEF